MLQMTLSTVIGDLYARPTPFIDVVSTKRANSRRAFITNRLPATAAGATSVAAVALLATMYTWLV